MVSLAISYIPPAETRQRIATGGGSYIWLRPGTTTEGAIRGPGFRVSDFESDMIIAQLQVDGAKTLMGGSLPAVQGPVKFVHTYLNMFVLPSHYFDLS
jgi:hypothetical protein